MYKKMIILVLFLTSSYVHSFYVSSSGKFDIAKKQLEAEAAIFHVIEDYVVSSGSYDAKILIRDLIIGYTIPSINKVREANDKLLRGVGGNDLYFVKQAVDEGAEIDTKNKKGTTALSNLIESNKNPSIEIIQLMLDSKADVNVANSFGATPLCVGIRFNTSNLSMVKLLLEAGAKYDKKHLNNDAVMVDKVKLAMSQIEQALQKEIDLHLIHDLSSIVCSYVFIATPFKKKTDKLLFIN